MSGLRIMDVNPRLIGSFGNLLEHEAFGGVSLPAYAQSLGFNALLFNPFFKTTDIRVWRDGQEMTGSLFASTSATELDAEFSAGSVKADDVVLRGLKRDACEYGVRLLGNLVTNHVAADHPLVLREHEDLAAIRSVGQNVDRICDHDGHVIALCFDDPDESLPGTAKDGRKEYGIKFLRHNNEGLELHHPSAPRTGEEWGDVAEINANSAAAMWEFVLKRDSYFKKQIDWFVTHGFSGFRVDAAHMVPAEMLKPLMQYAHDKNPEMVFIGETLGATPDQIARLRDNTWMSVSGEGGRKGFTSFTSGTFWAVDRGFVPDWYEQELSRNTDSTQTGSMGFLDNPDTRDGEGGLLATRAQLLRNRGCSPEQVAAVCVRDYAFAALAHSDVQMQLGTEFCRDQAGVFVPVIDGARTVGAGADVLEAHRKERAEAVQDISPYIAAINGYKDRLGLDGMRTRIVRAWDECGYKKIECVVEHPDGRYIGTLRIGLNPFPQNLPALNINGDTPESSLQLAGILDVSYDGWRPSVPVQSVGRRLSMA